jgi:hypothetical protein
MTTPACRISSASITPPRSNTSVQEVNAASTFPVEANCIVCRTDSANTTFGSTFSHNPARTSAAFASLP